MLLVNILRTVVYGFVFMNFILLYLRDFWSVSRLGYHTESLGYLRRAVAGDRLFLKAQENLDNVCSHLVERWHFRMLNDSVRNSAFQRAITRAVDSLEKTATELVVLDIGTGSGILRCEFTHLVHCCDLFTAAAVADATVLIIIMMMMMMMKT